ncbi:enoyl-CoA hydratase [Peribacillus sp. SCS-37]|uniref:enoyl-CoA hydratase n=1 Tax=Paraperibacillus esterisolvens TaxID=3115296 RepID=UPI003905C11C
METIKLEIQNHIAVILLNRPDAANALSIRLLNELGEIIEEVRNRSDIRAVILTGAGGKAFCAGADLKERAGMSLSEVQKTLALIGSTVTKLASLPQPVIAAVNGACFGGGLELALACDIRIASKTARLGLTETSLGIIPGAGGTQRLPRLIGISMAKELIYTARRLNAEEALSAGILSRVVDGTGLVNHAMDIAKEIAANAPIAVRAAKAAIDQGSGVSLHAGLQIEELCYSRTLATKDRLEGLAAFKEKRRPQYRGE